jgi:hypothetical protein
MNSNYNILYLRNRSSLVISSNNYDWMHQTKHTFPKSFGDDKIMMRLKDDGYYITTDGV